MRMFKPEELQKIKERYNEIYLPFIEYDFFSLLYDTSEEEWCYVISEEITSEQLLRARKHFLTLLTIIYNKDGNGKEIVQSKIKPFTISNYIDNCNNMMADKKIIKLYEKFNFMFPSFLIQGELNEKKN